MYSRIQQKEPENLDGELKKSKAENLLLKKRVEELENTESVQIWNRRKGARGVFKKKWVQHSEYAKSDMAVRPQSRNFASTVNAGVSMYVKKRDQLFEKGDTHKNDFVRSTRQKFDRTFHYLQAKSRATFLSDPKIPKYGCNDGTSVNRVHMEGGQIDISIPKDQVAPNDGVRRPAILSMPFPPYTAHAHHFFESEARIKLVEHKGNAKNAAPEIEEFQKTLTALLTNFDTSASQATLFLHMLDRYNIKGFYGRATDGKYGNAAADRIIREKMVERGEHGLFESFEGVYVATILKKVRHGS